MTLRLRAIALAVVVCTASAGRARADAAAEAKARYDQGVAAYGARDYETAVAAFKDAYALDPRPEILFSWAQAERLSGDCKSAIGLYRKFLDGHPSAVQAEAAQVPLSRCERSLASTPEPAPPAPPPPEPVPAQAIAASAPAPAPPARTREPFYTDVLGDVLVGAGVAAAAVGVGLLVSGDSPDGATTWADFRSRHDSAVTRRRAGGIVLGVGAALVAGGVTHWIFWSGGGETGVAAAGTF